MKNYLKKKYCYFMNLKNFRTKNYENGLYYLTILRKKGAVNGS